jgi:preprotein translocase subunit SecA
MAEDQIEALGSQFLSSEYRDEWDLEGMYRQALTLYPVPEDITAEGWTALSREEIETQLMEGVQRVYEAKQAELGEHMLAAEKLVVLDAVDTFWRRHLTDLDILREGIGLMAVAQRDPLVEYKREAYSIWQTLQDQIQIKAVQSIFQIRLREQLPLSQVQNIRVGRGDGAGTEAPEPVRATAKERLGRNDPCWCGSGKKYKSCHYRTDQAERQTQPEDAVRRSSKRRRR